jgi:hypothetical protein
VSETITTSAKRNIKVSTELSLLSMLTHGNSIFENSGPIPPKADQQTTYTVTWALDNTVNTVSGAVVKATLPVYVKWMGKISPSGEDLTYNANGEIIWKVGNVDTFTRNTPRRREVSFQIGLKPSVSQIGQVPFVLGDAKASAVDDYTGVTVTAEQAALPTRFSDGFQSGQDLVTQ